MRLLFRVFLALASILHAITFLPASRAQCPLDLPAPVPTQLTVSPQRIVGGSTQQYTLTLTYTIPECGVGWIFVESNIPDLSYPIYQDPFTPLTVFRTTIPLYWTTNVVSPGSYTETFTYTVPPVDHNTIMTLTAIVYASSDPVPLSAGVASLSASMTIVPFTTSISLDKGHLVGGSNETATATISFSVPFSPKYNPTPYFTTTPAGLLSTSGAPASLARGLTPTQRVAEATPVTVTAGVQFAGGSIASGKGNYSFNVTSSASSILYIDPIIPADTASETALGSSCNSSDPTCGGPIKLASGNTYIQQTDIRIPGLGGGLTLTRTWNSAWPSTQAALKSGRFGLNWRSTYEERVFSGSDGTTKYSREDGSFWSFGRGSNTSTLQVMAPANGGAILVPGSTYWTLTFKNGEQRLFDNASGSLTAIIDRNGNATALSYDGLNRLVTVTDPALRHLNFTYADASSPQVVSVSSDVGLVLSYSYDSQGRLTRVTKPDQTTVSFDYNGQSLITAVRDSDGNILESHTYDSMGRGVTSARAGSVDAVSITYPY
ncbi:MAG TPA: DUF6531 domain-containing protein [Terriglobales bacterium]|jgi:YD repeat-containing protein|nr:DUF6531 domain-containing protein [Terriglobales bacterium]